MTPARVKKILKLSKYKPGFKITLDESGDVEILLTAPNAYGSGTAEARSYVVKERWQGYTRDMQLITAVADAIWRLETHEYMEWFKYKGRRVYDPNH